MIVAADINEICLRSCISWDLCFMQSPSLLVKFLKCNQHYLSLIKSFYKARIHFWFISFSGLSNILMKIWPRVSFDIMRLCFSSVKLWFNSVLTAVLETTLPFLFFLWCMFGMTTQSFLFFTIINMFYLQTLPALQREQSRGKTKNLTNLHRVKKSIGLWGSFKHCSLLAGLKPRYKLEHKLKCN